MWMPNNDGLKELITLFKESRGKDNSKHLVVFNVKNYEIMCRKLTNIQKIKIFANT
jgi:hypothetical protein